MQLAPTDIARLEQFLTKLAGQTYPEEPSQLHTDITNAMLTRLLPLLKLPKKARVLDVGCGQGLALTRFKAEALQATGVTLNGVDFEACRAQGFDVRQQDQSFLDFPDATFDFIWCRHCLEHSCFPLFTLDGFHRVLKPGGWLYVEVPAPDTPTAHETNPNHYSTLSRSLWRSLIGRAGFTMGEETNVTFMLPTGPDEYFVFVARRAA